MCTSEYTNGLVQILIEAAQDTLEVPNLLYEINRDDGTLRDLHYHRKIVRSEISTWDRINILTKTEDEHLKKDLEFRIQILEEEITRYNQQLEQILFSIFYDLARTHIELYQILTWDKANQVYQAISEIDASGCSGCSQCWGCCGDEAGKQRALPQMAELISIQQAHQEIDLTVKVLLELMKSALLRNHWQYYKL